jgi:hypothetical protein
VDADQCPLLNDTLPHDDQPRVPDDTTPLDPNDTIPNPNYNPHVSALGFGGCNRSGAALSPGELQALGYPRGDPLVPGSTTGQSAKLTGFGSPYELDSNGTLTSVDDSGFGALEVTYFARLALIKDWERWHAEVSYERSSDDSGTLGTSSVQDALQLVLRWEPARLWSVALTGGYSLLDQASDVAIPSLLILENEPVEVEDNALSYTTGSVSLSASRQLSERSSLFAALYWYQQRQKVELDDSISFVPGVTGDDESISRWNNLTLWVGFDYHFDTLKF